VRLAREAQVLAALNHPNTAQLHGLEEAEGHPALFMELVEGPPSRIGSLEGRCRWTRPRPIARQVVEALGRARLRTRSSRPQAVEHQGPRGWDGQGPRFRSGEGVRSERRRWFWSYDVPDDLDAGHRRRNHPGHSRVHESGAGARPAGGQAQTAVPPSTPPAIRRRIRRCLERDPKRRVPDIAVGSRSTRPWRRPF
jgi:hypothetical protein